MDRITMCRKDVKLKLKDQPINMSNTSPYLLQTFLRLKKKILSQFVMSVLDVTKE